MRRIWLPTLLLLLLTFACTKSASPSPSSTTANGRQQATVTRVVDGDTIEVKLDGKTYKLRYIGVDTPETVDPNRPVGCFGPEASKRNKELVLAKTVELEKDVSETDAFGRLLRYVWLDGEMINARLVQDGFAQVATYPPDVKYQPLFLQLQRQAREAGAGLWSGCGGSPAPTTTIAGACDYSESAQPMIKGNISADGEKIYHVPGGAFYEQTVIDEKAGERWFCTEAEAVAAGWRKSRT